MDAEVKISETSIEEEEENCDGEGKNAENGDQRGSLSRSQRMNRDLDETSLMLEKLTQSLCFPVEERVTVNSRDGAARSEGVVVARSGTSDVGVVKRVHRDWQQSRQSTVSASISEPDLTQVLMYVQCTCKNWLGITMVIMHILTRQHLQTFEKCNSQHYSFGKVNIVQMYTCNTKCV